MRRGCAPKAKCGCLSLPEAKVLVLAGLRRALGIGLRLCVGLREGGRAKWGLGHSPSEGKAVSENGASWGVEEGTWLDG